MVHWMVQMLLHLAPEKGRKIPSESSLEASCSLTELHEKCKDLCDQISRITFYICQYVLAMVTEIIIYFALWDIYDAC